MVEDRHRDRVLGARLDRSRAGEEAALVVAVEGDHLDHARAPLGEGPGLVDREHLQRGRNLHEPASLEQDAVAGRRSERRNDADGCSDDERARTADDEEDERSVDPDVPGPSEE